jgi:DNA adenine methylase
VGEKAEPILKWAGGKRQLLSELLPLVPNYTGKYIEPFLGGGAMFFALSPENAVLSDCNEELISLYKAIKKDPINVINELQSYVNCEEEYYRVRGFDWKSLSEFEAAARMIFLNKTCYNGLYRVNLHGGFNVPYGKNTKTQFCNPEQIFAASNALKKKKLLCADYKKVLQKYAEPGDFIFLDPPYYQVTERETFLRYTSGRFYGNDQEELAELVNDLYDKGCHLMITNSNHPKLYELYKRFDIKVVQVRRAVNCKGNGRKGEDTIITAFH